MTSQRHPGPARGPWLPEPLHVDDRNASWAAELADSLAFLVVLEELAPVERAALLLHNVFD
jgi:RNA polymerase sigma-70 factor (ECF subfamily)